MVLASLGLVSATVSSAAFAGSPLLSGYGGPGAGEQAVIGSTLIGGSGGGAGSGGSSGLSGSGESSGSGSTASPAGASGSGATSAVTGGSSAGVSSGEGSGGKGAGSPHGSSHAAGSPSTHAGASSAGAQIHAFVYPTGPRSASYDSPTLGISGTDLLLFLAVIATLVLVAVATLRLSRLQREL